MYCRLGIPQMPMGARGAGRCSSSRYPHAAPCLSRILAPRLGTRDAGICYGSANWYQLEQQGQQRSEAVHLLVS